MLSPFARALTYYLGGGFALALICAIWYLDQRTDSDTDIGWRQRVRRRTLVLAPLGLGHPVVALAAVGLALDLARVDDRAPGFLLPVAISSFAVSLAGMVTVLAVTS